MPLKPIKRGYKVQCLSDSRTGFVTTFDVYTGKENIKTKWTLGERIAVDLSTDIKPGSIVVLDNFFTSISLLESLLERKIYACTV